MTSCSIQSADSSIEALIHRWGGSVSEALLEFPSHYFRLSHIDGCIGYHVECNCAIILGDPICSTAELHELTKAFHHYCAENHWNIIYAVVSASFSKWCLEEKLCHISLEVGEELIFDPQNDPTEGPRGNRLRNKISHARRYGLKVSEYLAYNEELEHAMEQVGVTWLKAREGPQIYLANLHFFDNRNGKRWFYIKDGDEVTGMALLSHLESHQGWLIKYLVTKPNAHRGTSELLVISILETLRNEDCHFLTYGIVPCSNLGQIIGLGKVASWVSKNVYKLANRVFHLEQRQLYWHKFHPNAVPTYVLFAKPKIGLREIRAISKAFKIKYNNNT